MLEQFKRASLPVVSIEIDCALIGVGVSDDIQNHLAVNVIFLRFGARSQRAIVCWSESWAATSRVVIVLFCAATWATAQDRARNPDHRTINGPVVPQAYVNARTIILPVVEENG